MSETREQIIQRAICEKLSSGVNYFTADDILIVAGITEEHSLRKIENAIKEEVEKHTEK